MYIFFFTPPAIIPHYLLIQEKIVLYLQLNLQWHL